MLVSEAMQCNEVKCVLTRGCGAGNHSCLRGHTGSRKAFNSMLCQKERFIKECIKKITRNCMLTQDECVVDYSVSRRNVTARKYFKNVGYVADIQ